MKIRKMKPSDIPAVIKIESETYENPVSETDLLKEIKSKNGGAEHPSLAPIVTFDQAGEVVGYLLFDRCPGSMKSLALAIVSTRKDCGRQGIATEMISYVKKKMKVLKYTSIVANVHQDRVPAQTLLAKSGFVCTGTYVAEMDDKTFEVCKFEYSVPLDDLSSRHIARIAKECREARASKQEE